MALRVPDDSLLHFSLIKLSFINPNETSFFRDTHIGPLGKLEWTFVLKETGQFATGFWGGLTLGLPSTPQRIRNRGSDGPVGLRGFVSRCGNWPKVKMRNARTDWASQSVRICFKKASLKVSKFPWCSGYHICLTHRRSPVRSRAETFFVFFSAIIVINIFFCQEISQLLWK